LLAAVGQDTRSHFHDDARNITEIRTHSGRAYQTKRLVSRWLSFQPRPFLEIEVCILLASGIQTK
jgi:hypothetical protein